MHSQIPKACLGGHLGTPGEPGDWVWIVGAPSMCAPTLLGPFTEMCPLRGPSTQKGPGASDPHFIDEEMKVGDRKDRLKSFKAAAGHFGSEVC